jgi:hypothetical protein
VKYFGASRARSLTVPFVGTRSPDMLPFLLLPPFSVRYVLQWGLYPFPGTGQGERRLSGRKKERGGGGRIRNARFCIREKGGSEFIKKCG